MRALKTILTISILLVAVLAALIALFWQRLLTPEQKLKYGLVFAAVEDYHRQAADDPADSTAMQAYISGLISEGNLGRATYLSELYGEPPAELKQLRGLVQQSLTAAREDRVFPLLDDPALQSRREEPIYQVARYIEGYRHALLGDWRSALNFFGAIDEKQLPPVLHNHWQYYLARSYRLAGDDEQSALVEGMLKEIIKAGPDPALLAKTRYNLLSLYLSPAGPAGVDLALANDQLSQLAKLPPGWSLQKAQTELAEHYLAERSYGKAWQAASAALQVNPKAQVSKSAGMLACEAVERLLDESSGEAASDFDRTMLQVYPGEFVDLAKAGVRFGYATRVAALLTRLRPITTGRDRYEELYAGLSFCYLGEQNLADMERLMSDANLSGLSDGVLCAIYYNYAQLLESRRQWNQSIEYYRSAGRLKGIQSGDAYFQCYAIIKEVQDPLDVDAAIRYLGYVVEGSPTSGSFHRAVEELAPLLIFQGKTKAAQNLLDGALAVTLPEDADRATRRDHEQLHEVAYWFKALLAERAGRIADADSLRAKITNRYWNYYELTSSYPPRMPAAATPTGLGEPETAGEYLAGFGLDASAAEFFEGVGDAGNQLRMYLSLRNREMYQPLSSLQWNATELLESGVLVERPVLEHALRLAYPRPFVMEVQQATNAQRMNPNLIYAVMKKETNFKPDSVSSVGARGLMQLMPASARWLNSRYELGLDPDNLEDPATNVMFGAANLASLYDQLGANNTRGVIHAYNGGAANYKKWAGIYGSDPFLLTELIPNDENESFGKRVVKYFKLYEWLGE